MVVGAFVFATIVSAGMLWFYEWPLFVAPVSGFIILGVMLVFWYDSWALIAAVGGCIYQDCKPSIEES